MKQKILLITFFINGFLFSQNLKTIYKKHDQTINLKSTPLSNGVLFIEKIKKIKKNHNYYLTNNFLPANLKYKGQLYYDINIKYDILNDIVIAEIPDNRNNFVVILENRSIDFFKIDEHKFIQSITNGFLEERFITKKTSLYLKHIKLAKKEVDEKFIHYSFTNKTKYFIKNKSTFSQINSKKSLTNTFPKLKKSINEFYKTEKELKKRNVEQFYIKLIKKINNEISKELI